MLIKARNCSLCMKSFIFESSQCSQIIVGQGKIDSKIVFLAKCPYCGAETCVEVPWSEYKVIDY
jgi:hypothetical protein